jgi:hypothetical protein
MHGVQDNLLYILVIEILINEFNVMLEYLFYKLAPYFFKGENTSKLSAGSRDNLLLFLLSEGIAAIVRRFNAHCSTEMAR